MRNLKKIIAVVVTLVMLIGVVGISASAADEAVNTIVLSGRTQAYAGDTYELTVSLEKGGDVKGVEGVITYDADVFTYVNATLSETFKAENGGDEALSIQKTADGTLKFVGLDGTANGGEWFTLNFTTSATAGAADQFSATVKGANETTYQDVTVAAADALTTYPDGIITVAGAWLLAADTPDLQFEINYDAAKLAEYTEATVAEYGIITMFTSKLNGAELTYDKIGTTGVASAKATGTPDEEMFATIKGSYAIENILGVKISARAFIKLNDAEGTVIYSNNDIELKVADGYSSKSLIGCAKQAAAIIAPNVEDAEDKAALEAYSVYAGVMPAQDKQALLDLLKTYDVLFEAIEA